MLNIDFKNSFKNSQDLEPISNEMQEARNRFLNEDLGFKKLPYQFEDLKPSLEKALELTKDFGTIVIIGIGGSDLGTRALHRALNHQYHNELTNMQVSPESKKIYFAGDTTDTEAISQLQDILDLKDTVFLVISKSGNTIEQGSVFLYFKALVSQQLEDDSRKHFLFLTDSSYGNLHEIAVEEGYETINIPSDIGGRFSVLSSVGMIPAHLLGLNVEEFLNGARELHENISASLSFQEDMVMQYSAVQYLHYKEQKEISVLMPYNYSLSEFAKWYQQLYGESLGEKRSENVNFGVTPIAALGPVDQHSQLQLYNDGPNNKLFTFIISEEAKKDLNLPQEIRAEQYNFLSGKNFGEILKIELETTAYSLTKNGRPNLTITLPTINEFYLGQLFYFFEVAVVYLGYLMGVNPFDQPGVEVSKNAINGVLGKPGFESYKTDFDNYKNS